MLLLLESLGTILLVVVKDHESCVDFPHSQLVVWRRREQSETQFLHHSSRWCQMSNKIQLREGGMNSMCLVSVGVN